MNLTVRSSPRRKPGPRTRSREGTVLPHLDSGVRRNDGHSRRSAWRGLRLLALTQLLLLAAPTPAFAHALGRGSVNQALTVTAEVPDLKLSLALDLAETLTAREMTRLDQDRDGQVSPAEEARYVGLLGGEVAGALDLKVGGQAARALPAGGGVQFFTGEQGFPTALVTLAYRAPLAALLRPGVNRVEIANWAWWNTPGQSRVRAIVPEGGPFPVTTLPAPEGSNPLALRDLALDVKLPDDWIAPADAAAAKASPGTISGDSAARDENPILTALRARELSPWAWVATLGLAFFFGMVHSLSPGHGKTLATAFLLGRRAQVRHAVGLGLVVTLAHILGVVALGAVSALVSGFFDADRLSALVSAGSGAAIVVIGLVMLARRAGHTHGHPHEHGRQECLPHDLPAPGTSQTVGQTFLSGSEEPTFGEILALGFSGGVAPCPTALVILLLAIAVGRIGFGLALIVAFSLGLAVVLVAGGVAVVRLGEAVLSRAPGLERFYPHLLRLSAGVITLLGVALLVQGLLAAGVLTIHV